jgi:hypothetical protein
VSRLPLNPESDLFDRVLVAVNEPDQHAHVSGNLAPTLIVAIQLVADAQRRPFRVGNRPEAKGEVPWSRCQAQLRVRAQRKRLAVDAQRADFHGLIRLAAVRSLGRDAAAQPAQEPTNAHAEQANIHVI